MKGASSDRSGSGGDQGSRAADSAPPLKGSPAGSHGEGEEELSPAEVVARIEAFRKRRAKPKAAAPPAPVEDEAAVEARRAARGGGPIDWDALDATIASPHDGQPAGAAQEGADAPAVDSPPERYEDGSYPEGHVFTPSADFNEGVDVGGDG